jgi:hypothetical protein
LSATFQSGTGSEKMDCGVTRTVTCTSPTTPSISPTSSTINTGQNVTYTISGGSVVSNTWYAVRDNTGKSYATSIYNTSGTGFTLSTTNFSSAGTYNLLISADKLSGCAASTASAAVIVNAVVTPVRFITVNAKKASQGVAVNWTVADETGVNHYEIEKSFDGVNFGVVGSVAYKQPTAAQNQYTFTDVSASNTEKVYYCVREVDNNLYYTLSSIVMVRITSDKTLQIWPNPATSQVYVNITVSSAQTTYVELLDLTGKKLLSQQVNLTPGSNSVVLKNLNSYSSGVYLLRVLIDGENNNQKIVIK